MRNKICCYLLIIVLLTGIIFIIDYIQIRQKLERILSRQTTEFMENTTKKQANGKNVKNQKSKDMEKILENYIKKQKDYLTAEQDNTENNRFIPDIMPINNTVVVSQKYSEKHPGVDLVAPSGTEIVATAAGKVEISSYDEYFGNLIILEHFNGYYTYYGHLQEVSKKKGEFVEKREILGSVGSTGFSSGPHLHYSIQKDGKFIDPGDFIK